MGKHPHGRGEDRLSASPDSPAEETPPRTWGRPLQGSVRRQAGAGMEIWEANAWVTPSRGPQAQQTPEFHIRGTGGRSKVSGWYRGSQE